MSSVSQTSPARARLSFAARMVLTSAVVLGVIAMALGPLGPPVVRMIGSAQLHAPDLSVWDRLSAPVRIHLATALAALVLGAVLMAVRKGRTFHRVAGWTWVALVSVTAGATLFITSLNHGSWSLLHLFTGWTLIVLPLGVMAARRRQVVRHRKTMMGLFYGAFAINLGFAFLPGRALWVMFFG
jgi:uncharacterized membrane protein